MSAADTAPVLTVVEPGATAVPALPTPADLTDQEAATLRHIRELLAEHGRPPTVRELCAALGVTSSSTVVWYLDHLEAKGYIRRTRGVTRGLRLVGDVPGQCPTCGRGGAE